jgi:phospholipid-transporting ATPase
LKLDVADEETDNKFREPFFNFYDDRLMGLEWSKQPNTELTCQFFRLLALCHTVIPEGRYTAAAGRLTVDSHSCVIRHVLR